MLLSEINSSCDNSVFLSIMQGEEFDYTITADDDLDLSYSTALFIVRESLGGIIGFTLSTADETIVITGQEVLLKFRDVTNVVGEFLCQFVFTDTVTGVIVKSNIAQFIIKESLGSVVGEWPIDLGYTPEDSANKSTSILDSASTVKFPVWSAIVSFFDTEKIKSLLGVSTISLIVVHDGQTEFTVFSISENSLLLINGVEYYPITHYTITQIGPNVTLTWLNDFELKTDFIIKLRKF